MKASKRILKHTLTQGLLALVISLYIRVVWHTTRWKRVGDEHVSDRVDRGEPVIIAFWHARLVMMAMAQPRRFRLNVLISHHADGQMIARVVRHFGLGAVSGSTSKGGRAALRQMIAMLKDGMSIAVTPDGPRGPAMKAVPGVVQLARLSGVPIVPSTYSVARTGYTRSWDRMFLPHPFNRGVLLTGPPIHVARTDDLAARTAQLEASLRELTRQADALCSPPPPRKLPPRPPKLPPARPM